MFAEGLAARQTDRPGRLTMVVLVLAIASYSVSLSLTYAALALDLGRAGYGPDAIGLHAAATPLGFIVCSAFVPRLARMAAQGRLLVGAMIVAAFCLLGMATGMSFWLSLILRFIMGGATNVLFIIGEAALMTMASSASRGRVMGAYNGVVTLGYGIGPALLLVASSHPQLPFVVGAAVALLSALVMQSQRRHLSRSEAQDAPASGRVLLTLPIAIAGCAAAALFDNAFMSLFAQYYVSLGGETVRALLLLSAALVGGTVLQWPIGYLGDRIGTRFGMTSCALVAIGCLALLFTPVALTNWEFAILFLAGGAAFGVYSMTLALIAQSFTGAALVAANAGLATVWGLSSLVGLPLTGLLMSQFGTSLFPILIVLPFLALLALAGARPSTDVRRERASQ